MNCLSKPHYEPLGLSIRRSKTSAASEEPRRKDALTWFRGKIDELEEFSADLASKRALAMYGLEAAGKSPSELFEEEQAAKALGEQRWSSG